jgi:hypothetical protein
VLAYTHYGGKRLVKAAAWAAAAVLALLIIAARKHYTVDVVIAWYTVPMVYTLLHVFWRQRCSSSSYAALPTTAEADYVTSMSTGKGGIDRCVADVPTSNKQQQIELPSSWNTADCSCSSSCRCSADGVTQSTGSSGSYSSSYNISPRSSHAGAASGGADIRATGGRTVSPRRARNVWLFGHAPWQQQRQEQVPIADAAEDLEAQASAKSLFGVYEMDPAADK